MIAFTVNNIFSSLDLLNLRCFNFNKNNEVFGIETVTLTHLFHNALLITMISKSIIKLIKSLSKKKYRIKENLFLAEGDKIVLEVLNSDFAVKKLIATEDFIAQNTNLANRAEQLIQTEKEQIKKASLLQNPQNSIAICALPHKQNLPRRIDRLSFYLDGIQDPGNLGTIIRTCDWYGIQNIFISSNTVDVYNPKVIQASMGSFCRVNVIPVDIQLLKNLAEQSKLPVYGTFMEGKNIYSENLVQESLIIMGNEGSGIREEAAKLVTNKISIPTFSENSNTAESLNVAIAAGIICSEFKRRTIS